MSRARAFLSAACTVLASCSLFTESNTPRFVSTSVVLTNSLRTGVARPPGPFASVLDSVVLVVKSTTGEVIATSGYKLRAYDSTASMQIEIPTGDALFDVQVLSRNRSIVFKGSRLATVTDDDTPITIDVVPERPVMLVLPDTSKTSVVLNTTFAVYNAGNSVLSPSEAARDTALTRCGTACTITITPASVPPGQTATVRLTVPQNFPSRLFSFVLRSAEGDVTVFWQYDASPITNVSVEPPTALLVRGQTTPFTATVQAIGNASTAVIWTSASESLVRIGATGIATGVSLGLTNVVATSTVDPAKAGTANVRVYDSTSAGQEWTILTPSAPITIRRDAVTQPNTVTITGVRFVPGNNALNPYTVVEFWARPAGLVAQPIAPSGAVSRSSVELISQLLGSWRRIGQSSAPSVRDFSPDGREFTWRIDWNPNATDAPFANPSSTQLLIRAIGVAANGQATTTASNGRITVVVP